MIGDSLFSVNIKKQFQKVFFDKPRYPERMKKADYTKIAPFYDKGRSLSEQNIKLWLNLIAKGSNISGDVHLLDLGCGTGRFAIPIGRDLNFRVTGADSSEEMLAKAKEKDKEGLITWDCVEAHSLKYYGNTFDILFMSHLLHHVDIPTAVIDECHRVLKPSGVILIRYGAMEQIRYDVEHTFFPGVIEIDEKRTPTVNLVEGWLKSTGFVDIVSEEIVQQTFQSGLEHLEAARLRNTSVLNMISEEAFETGVEHLAQYVSRNPDDPWLLFDRMTLTSGQKIPEG
jgi:ubiquinone/menaquinone biosynthesis C-methylase UbiE